jgi:iron complex transport system substrate-binding protein
MRCLLILGCSVAVALVGCGRTEPDTEAAVSASLTETASVDASRIVALGGPVTETLAALGFDEQIVATDRSSLWPESLVQKPRLDYFRQTSAEAVLAQRPTLVVALVGTGPLAVVEQIESAGVPVLTAPEALSVGDAVARVRMLGAALGREAAADSVVRQMERELDAASAMRPETPPRALFVYARGAGLVMTFGQETAADAVLRLAGAENAVTGFEGSRPLTAEGVVSAAPEVIVIPARGLESVGGIDGLLQKPGLAQTPAGKARRVVAVDDALLLGFGPRLGQGIADLAKGLSAKSNPAPDA